jgi:hypothetical protein
MHKYIRIILTFALVLILNGWTVSANNFLLRAYIPFEFTVGSKTLPPGTYYVNRVEGSEAAFNVRGVTEVVYFFSHAALSGGNADPAKLVFNRYGERYFLREVWFSKDRGYPLRVSRSERELVTARAADKGSERVVVAAGIDRQ